MSGPRFPLQRARLSPWPRSLVPILRRVRLRDRVRATPLALSGVAKRSKGAEVVDPQPADRPSVAKLNGLDWLLIAAAVGCVVAIVFAPVHLGLLKAALAFWGAGCVAMVSVNIALRSAYETLALRRRVAYLEQRMRDLEADVARLARKEERADGRG